ncbi:MAG: alkaline phosphatase family protein [Gemmatimonadales bacterium]|nr:alkaline phosphatase family protein [Gemmatimonadales bacterium]
MTLIPLLVLSALGGGDGRAAPPRPRLVVVITIDQFRPDYFERWKPQITGGLFQLLNEGAVFSEGYQDHAATETAPGHATILSGLWPAHNGILRNNAGVQDSTAPLLVATNGPGASPRRFRGTTLFDWLKAVDPAARALSVSRKDRGAILPIGHAKQQVYWYQSGIFTTSRYYADSLPAWVRAFNARGLPFKAAGTAWTLLLPDSAYQEEDNEPWENRGRDIVFPHRYPVDTARAASMVANTPAIDSLTLLFALEGLETLRLGHRSNGTDLLAVSLSATDAVGHSYGPDSREVHDQVLRLDRYLGWFLKRVTDRVGRDNVVIVLTADHGVTPLPERVRAKTGTQVYRVLLDTLVTAVNRELDRLAGGGGASREWLSFDSGMLFLQDNGRFAAMSLNTDSIIDAVAARIRAVPGVARADQPADLARADTVSDPVARRWIHHIPADAGIVLAVTPHPGSIWDIPNVPIAMHGHPSEDDAHVPIILWGRGVKRGTYAGRMNTVDIAPTLGQLLGVTPLSLIDGHARTDALVPRD